MTLEIARDFDYRDKRGLLLDVIHNGTKERWLYRTTVSQAHKAHAKLREGSAKYIDPHAERSEWLGAPVKDKTHTTQTAQTAQD